MNEVVREFLLETHENLAQLDLDLVTLEKDPTERETLARVFRTLHTVKGTAGFLGLPKLQAVAHAAETLLSRLRSGELLFGAEIATALLGVVDAIRTILAGLEATETEGPADYAELIRNLERLTRGEGAPAKPPPPPPEAPPPGYAPTTVADVPLLRPKEEAAPAEARAPAVADTTLRVDVGLLDKLMTLVGELVLA